MGIGRNTAGSRRGTGKTEVIVLVVAIGVAALVAVTLFGQKLSDQGKSMGSALDGGATGTPAGNRPVDLRSQTSSGDAPASTPAAGQPTTDGTKAPGLHRREGGSDPTATSPFTEVADFEQYQNQATLAGRAQRAIDAFGIGSMGPADARVWDDLQRDDALRKDALAWLEKHQDWTTKDSPVRKLHDLLDLRDAGTAQDKQPGEAH